MKTKIALAFYYLAVGFLVIVAGVIVLKLIFWPPCTQIGTTCAVDPWSTAGLAGTMLAVSATVLAILGAVAVAAWWTSLNAIVTGRVKKLYKTQQNEVQKVVAAFLAEQKQEVSDQLGRVQTSLQSVEQRITAATTDIDELEKLTYDFFDIAVDGIVLSLPGALETWAQKVVALHKFPRVPLKMAERYLDVVECSLTGAEQEVMRNQDGLEANYQTYNSLSNTTAAGVVPTTPIKLRIEHIGNDCRLWLDKDEHGESQTADTLNCWESALRWRTIAKDEKADAESLRWLDEKISAYRFKIDLLKIGSYHLKEQTQRLLDLTEHRLQTTSPEGDALDTTNPT